jgi:hypothetical protein
MRLLELKLNEAGLTASAMPSGKESGTKDKNGRLLTRQELFLYKIKNKSPFLTTAGQQVIINPKELAKATAWIGTGNPVGKLTLTTTTGETIETGKLLKTPEFGGKGGGAAEGKIGNRGNVAEGILGGALFAKLSARINGNIGKIGPSDVWRSVYALKKSGQEEYSVTVKDAGKKVVNDQIIFTLKLAESDYNDLMDPKKQSLLTDLTASAVEFVNSKDGQDFAEHYYLNGKPDVIRVISDGVSDQKGQKTDVKVIATDPRTGQKREMELNMSLKTKGIPQFGQVGAGAVKKKGDMFRAQKTLWEKFGVDVNSLEQEFEEILDKDGIKSAMQMMYQSVADVLGQLLSGDFDDEEYIYLKQFTKGINYHATLNDPNVLLVDFVNGTYDVLNFNLIEDKLKDINLDARYNESERGDNPGLPKVEIFDKTSGKRLLQIRYYLGAGGRKHLIEKGPLLSELISVKTQK